MKIEIEKNWPERASKIDNHLAKSCKTVIAMHNFAR